MHKHVHSKATYVLSTSSQHSKWVKKGKEGTNIHSTQNQYAQTCSFNGNLLAGIQHSKWVKEVKEGNEFSIDTNMQC